MIRARYQRAPRRMAAIWVVLHCTAGSEGPGKARDGALEHARPGLQRPRSCHFFVDTIEVVQCVGTHCEAWHAGHTANMHGIGIELCGAATQTREQWLDARSLPMLALAARLTRQLCDEHGIPAAFVGAHEVRLNTPGITTHAEISKAFPTETTHTDPGPCFPSADFVRAVQLAAALA